MPNAVAKYFNNSLASIAKSISIIGYKQPKTNGKEKISIEKIIRCLLLFITFFIFIFFLY